MCECPGFEAGVWRKPNKLCDISHLSQKCRVPRLPDMGIELLDAGQWGLGPREESPGKSLAVFVFHGMDSLSSPTPFLYLVTVACCVSWTVSSLCVPSLASG